ncbi:trans-sulfuration enzyme family protein [Eisenibacter elegans]|jgi:cystathionine beta-lyase/cystathionine gamma-synthase|uniref:trans-sulfuration enzyme family protein n=1 Tax=Eisenibacter elegans TaxID=997 RepID=UPI00040316D2|nr:aminotransferase class I/II-fold pyridoxal phosphate-dependent enzyme [Eisenibacter elegans]
MDDLSADLSYIINHLGEDRSQFLNAAAPPIYQSVMFAFQTVAEMRHTIQHESELPFYTRGHNPTTDILRQKMAALEKAEDALIFSSGVAAISAALLANLKAGDHVVAVQKPYSWTNRLLTEWMPRFGISVTQVDGQDIAQYEAAIRPNTRILYAESPNSWTFEQQDLRALAQLAKKHQLLTVVDNSYATPLLQNPIEMGIDIVCHSATKYIAGHSDAVAGVACGTKAMMQQIFNAEYMTMGGVASPFNSWLLLRGLRTLPLRMERVAKTTPEIVRFLEAHPAVAEVYYPYSPNNPQYELAKSQMKQPAGQFSIRLKADQMEQVEAFCNHLKRFLLAVSWGSYESLIFPACVLYDSENYQGSVLPWDMIRFYIGLEEPESLLDDLRQALDAVWPQ